MSFSGNLQSIHLADVFQNIAANSVTGTLRVRWRKEERYVLLEGGKIAGFSMGVGKGLDILGHLVQRGYVDVKKSEKLVARNKKSRKPITRLIVEGGLLNDEDLYAAFAEQVEEQIFDLMQLKEAEFDVSEGAPPSRVFGADQQRLALALQAGPLLVEGARRRDEWDRINNVITSDDDLFVLLDGWEELDLDEFTVSVAEWLDGNTSIGAVVAPMQASRFDVLKAVSDVVHLGGARPCTPDEVDAMAQDAVAAGDSERAIVMLRHALSRERNNHDLRTRFAELLAGQGKAKDAAAEYATLGYQLANEGDCDGALDCYGMAVELAPKDLPLQERRVDLLVEAGLVEDLASAALGLVAVYEEMGLADRSRILLRKLVKDGDLAGHDDLFAGLARVEAALGNWKEASRIYTEIGERLLVTDEARALAYMRMGLEQSPDDEVLASRIIDIESGQQRKRQTRRRMLAFCAAVVLVTGLLGYGGLGELRASYEVSDAMNEFVGADDDDVSFAALRRLESVADTSTWLPSATRARSAIETVVDVKLIEVNELLVSGDYVLAETLLGRLDKLLEQSDTRVVALTRRSVVEHEAYMILLGTEEGGDPSAAQQETLAGMTDRVHLDFHLAHLPTLRNIIARRAQLKALASNPESRVLRLVTSIFLFDEDGESRDLAHDILKAANEQGVRLSDVDHSALDPVLVKAKQQAEVRDRAGEVIRLLARESDRDQGSAGAERTAKPVR